MSVLGREICHPCGSGRNAWLAIIMISAIIILCQEVQGACDITNTPKIIFPERFVLKEDVSFSYDFNLSNMGEAGVIYSYALLGRNLAGINLSRDGVLDFTPKSSDRGSSRIAVVAVKGSCADTAIVTLEVFVRPKIVDAKPALDEFGTNQTATINFSVKVELDDPEETVTYEWLFDSQPIVGSAGRSSLLFTPGFNVSGVHNITVIITDSYNLSSVQVWEFQVLKVNRPPVLVHEVPGFVLFSDTGASAYDLNDYIRDPDGGRLFFGFRQVQPSYDFVVAYAQIRVSFAKDGTVFFDPMTGTLGYAYFVFIASDMFNATAESNIVKVDVINSQVIKRFSNMSIEEFCGNYFCGQGENCTTCSFDCGLCEGDLEGCRPDWNCTAWGACMPLGFQMRRCNDMSDCDDNRTKPDEIKQCIYSASCNDSIKNGIETGVDCGGPCVPCPSCSDKIQNQGEGEVDCGGPCVPCPSCSDRMLNQNESDVDCGGSCKKCQGNQSCKYGRDCESLDCRSKMCTFASCHDNVRNQGEKGIDCEGPCPKLCGNCSDGLQNQGEEGVDCGGKCAPCPSCDDGKKNGGERFTDCGGPCRKCAFADLFKAYILGFVMLGLILLITMGVFLFYVFLVFARPQYAKRLYDNNKFFMLMIGLNRFCRKCRVIKILGRRKQLMNPEEFKSYREELIGLSNRTNVAPKEMHSAIVSIYASIFKLPDQFDDAAFYSKAKESRVPVLLKVLLLGFYKKSDRLLLDTFIPDEEKNNFLSEFIFLITELSKE
ncbi:MAG: hypothetical protein V1866_04015 [archaeon]